MRRSLLQAQAAHGVLTAELTASLCKGLRPDDQEVAGMLDELINVHGFTPHYLSCVCGFLGGGVVAILECRAKLNHAQRRLIWCLWLAQKNPAALQIPVRVASWDRAKHKIPPCPKDRSLTAEQFKTIVEQLESWMADISHDRLALGEIVQHFSCTHAHARHAVKQAQYRLASASNERRSLGLPAMLHRGAIWWSLDWRERNEFLASEHGKSVRTIRRARYALSKLSHETIAKALEHYGIGKVQRFEPFLL